MTLNPETQILDFETATVFIPDLSAFNGQPLSAVAEHLISTYGDKYYLPGIEYWQWLCEHDNLTDLPAGPKFEALKQNLKDNYCFFFGSTLRRSSGRWIVPCLRWTGTEWRRLASRLGIGWRSSYRVVLLERWLSFCLAGAIAEAGLAFDFLLNHLILDFLIFELIFENANI